ncbi:hypothetical protein AB4Z22_34845, partial [Paenibacillus sp. TAF58]
QQVRVKEGERLLTKLGADVYVVALAIDGEMWTSEDIIPVIGFQLVGKSDMPTRKIKGPITMLEALFGTMLSAHDERYIEQKNRFRTVKIPTLGVGNTQFNLSKELSMSLYDSGFKASNDYFNNWSAETYEQNYEKLVLRRQ